MILVAGVVVQILGICWR